MSYGYDDGYIGGGHSPADNISNAEFAYGANPRLSHHRKLGRKTGMGQKRGAQSYLRSFANGDNDEQSRLTRAPASHGARVAARAARHGAQRSFAHGDPRQSNMSKLSHQNKLSHQSRLGRKSGLTMNPAGIKSRMNPAGVKSRMFGGISRQDLFGALDKEDWTSGRQTDGWFGALDSSSLIDEYEFGALDKEDWTSGRKTDGWFGALGSSDLDDEFEYAMALDE